MLHNAAKEIVICLVVRLFDWVERILGLNPKLHSANTNVGKNSLVYTSGSTLQDGDGRVGPLTWFQQSSDTNAGGGVYNPITDGSGDFYMEENPEEFVWINVYDLEPGYSFSYQQGGQVFIQTS